MGFPHPRLSNPISEACHYCTVKSQVIGSGSLVEQSNPPFQCSLKSAQLILVVEEQYQNCIQYSLIVVRCDCLSPTNQRMDGYPACNMYTYTLYVLKHMVAKAQPNIISLAPGAVCLHFRESISLVYHLLYISKFPPSLQ